MLKPFFSFLLFFGALTISFQYKLYRVLRESRKPIRYARKDISARDRKSTFCLEENFAAPKIFAGYALDKGARDKPFTDNVVPSFVITA